MSLGSQRDVVAWSGGVTDRYLEHIHFDSVCQACREGMAPGVGGPPTRALGKGGGRCSAPPAKAHKKTPAGGWGVKGVWKASQRPLGGRWTNQGALAKTSRGIFR